MIKRQIPNCSLLRAAVLAAWPLLAALDASAHVSYSGRDFGTLTDGSSVTISNQTVTGVQGWADGTDDDFGDSHKLRAFRFTLTSEMIVSTTFTGSATGNGTIPDGNFLPGFSIYSGLAHVAPVTTELGGSPDYDFSAITQDYLTSLGGVPKEGAFEALDDWRMGGDNQTGPAFDYNAYNGLSTFLIKGYGVDGTAANFGSTPGIVGDGLADGYITASFLLPAGDYSIFVGGANYSGANTGTYRLSGTVSATAAPEPGRVTLVALAGCGLFLRRRRK